MCIRDRLNENLELSRPGLQNPGLEGLREFGLPADGAGIAQELVAGSWANQAGDPIASLPEFLHSQSCQAEIGRQAGQLAFEPAIAGVPKLKGRMSQAL